MDFSVFLYVVSVSVASYVYCLKLLEFVKLALANRLISELIHLARWVKLNPWFNPGLALIGVCGMQFNSGLNFNPGLGDLTLG